MKEVLFYAPVCRGIFFGVITLQQKKVNIRKLCTIGIMSGLGALLMFFEFPVPALMPPFIKMDFSELPALLTAFAFGPLSGAAVCFIKNILHLFAGQSMGIGELSNFILGAVFTLTAGVIYKHGKTRKSALIGCLTGSAAMAVFSVFSNYFVIYPLYIKVLGFTMDAIVGMYREILPSAGSLFTALLIFNLPFTFIKGIIDSIFCFIIYKPLSPVMKGKR